MSRSHLSLVLALLTQLAAGFGYMTESERPLTTLLLWWSGAVLFFLWLFYDSRECGHADRAPHPLAFLFFAPMSWVDPLAASRGWAKGAAMLLFVAAATLASFHGGAWLALIIAQPH